MRLTPWISIVVMMVACTADGDPVASGTDGDTEATTSGASAASASSAGSMSASSTSAGSATSTSASTTEGSSSDPTETSGPETATDVTGHSSMTDTNPSGSGSGTDSAESGSASGSTGTVACIEMKMPCGEAVEGECCEGTECVAGAIGSVCLRCGVEDDPCSPEQAPCCDGFVCQANGGVAMQCVAE